MSRKKNELLVERSDAGSCNPVVKMSFYPQSGAKGEDCWAGMRAHEYSNKEADGWMQGDFEIVSQKGDLKIDGLEAIAEYVRVRDNYVKSDKKQGIENF